VGLFPQRFEKVRCNCRKVFRLGGAITLGKLFVTELWDMCRVLSLGERELLWDNFYSLQSGVVVANGIAYCDVRKIRGTEELMI